jgi:6-phosphofructokinase 1
VIWNRAGERAMNGNLLITMSGGTTTVINATLAGIIREVQETGCFQSVLAGVPGIVGVLKDKIVDLGRLNAAQLKQLRQTPGSAVVGTTRVSVLSSADLMTMAEVFERRNVKAFVNIGGNGTLQQTIGVARAFGSALRVAAAPKTVDNDLGDPECKRVLFTPGFPSCVNHWSRIMNLLNIENLGACSHDRVLVAQTFGRETGFLAGAVRAVDIDRHLPLVILLPEDPQPISRVLDVIDNTVARHGRAIVILSEGYEIGQIGKAFDATGQTMYGSSQTTASQLLVDSLMRAGLQARSYIPTVLQRQSGFDTMEFDRDVAERQGRDIVRRLAAGEEPFLATVVDPVLLEDPVAQPFQSIAFEGLSDFSRRLHPAFIDTGGFDVSEHYLDYLFGLFRVSRFEKKFASVNPGLIMPHDVADFFL